METAHTAPAVPLLVIVAGPPCTGKTTLGLRLARDLGLPFVHKDGIKERLFDCLGWKDRAWSRQLGAASMELLYYFVATQLEAGRSLVVESNFKAEYDTERFLGLRRRYPCEPFQIQCHTDGETLYRRFVARAESGQRHPGHVDRDNYTEFQSLLLAGRHPPLEIGGRRVEIDTTDFAAVDYMGLLEAIRGG